MNDRFRFRVWFNGLKRYNRNTDNLVLNDGGELGGFDTVGCYSEKDAVVEQCTGLKDKKGNLIYEGDIIYPNYEIKWSSLGYVLPNGNNLAFYNGTCEVIGNIHDKESK